MEHFKIARRISCKSIGYFFSIWTEFDNIKVINCTMYKKIHFTYKGKKHYVRIYKNKYGDYFVLNNTTFYILTDYIDVEITKF